MAELWDDLSNRYCMPCLACRRLNNIPLPAPPAASAPPAAM